MRVIMVPSHQIKFCGLDGSLWKNRKKFATGVKTICSYLQFTDVAITALHVLERTERIVGNWVGLDELKDHGWYIEFKPNPLD
jgi:hypothetical protein